MMQQENETNKGTAIQRSGDFSQMKILVKSKNRQYLGLDAKSEKNKGTFFSATLKVGESKVVLLLSILASRPRY